jgi:regulator of nonsense transcripts 2
MSSSSSKGAKYVAKPGDTTAKPAKRAGNAKQTSNAEETLLKAEEARLKLEEARIAAEEAEKRRLEALRAEEEAAQRADLENGALVEVKARLSLRLLRDQNLAAHNGNRPDISHFRSLVSTIAKCSGFARKLAKISAESQDALLKELRSLNLSKYVSELAANVASAPLKPTDLDAAVAICSEIHQLYVDFAPELLPLLVRLVSPSGKAELAPRRIALRLLVELFVAGVIVDQAALTSVLKELLDPNAKDALKQTPVTLQLVLSLVRSGGRDLLGLVPKSNEAKLAQYQQAGMLKWSEKLPVELKHLEYEMRLPNLISPERRVALLSLITQFYQKVATIFLQSHKKLRETEQKNHEILVNRHELSPEASNAYAKQLEQFENFQKTLVALSDMLHLEMPNLPQQEKITRIKEPKAGSSNNDSDELEEQGPWESEEAKRFYEVIPELKDFLPSSLLTHDASKLSNTESLPSADSPAPGATEEASEAATSSSSDISTLPASTDPSFSESSAAQGDQASSSGNPGVNAEPVPETLMAFYEKLLRCSNRQLIDESAMEFVKFNQKAWRTKLVNLMHSAPRNRLDNLRYFSRFLAILNPYFKGMGAMLVKRLEEEFLFLFKQKDQTNSPAKIWNARFLGELTKFKICAPNTVLNLLKKCLDDFIGYNVHVACELVDTCGRYLLSVPETRMRTTILLDQMTTLKNAKSLHVTLEILIDNALATARPIERVQKQVVQLPPVQQYIQKLLYLELKKSSVPFIVTQLRKMPWQTEEAFILKTMLKVYKNKYQHIGLVALIVAQLSLHHETFGVRFLDHVLEEIRADLEERNFKNHQKLIMNVTLAGELINHKLADSKLFYKLLYSFIRYNTITIPKSGPTDFSFKPIVANDPKNASSFDFYALGLGQVPSMKEQQRDHQAFVAMAWVEDSFRIRLVCTLFNTCRALSCFTNFSDSQSGRTNAREMESFLVYFQCFLFAQQHITPELNSLLDDTWYLISPPYLLRTPQELEAKLTALRASRPSFNNADERFSLPYKISSSAAAEEEDGDLEDATEEISSLSVSELATATDHPSHNEESASEKSDAGRKVDSEKPGEDELSRMFDSMMQDTMGVRTNVNTRANSIFSVPWMALKRKAEVMKEAPEIIEIPKMASSQPSEVFEMRTSQIPLEEGKLGQEASPEEFGEESDEDEESDFGSEGSGVPSDCEEDEEANDEDLDDEDGEEDEEDDPEEFSETPVQTEPAETPAMKFQFLARRPGNKPVLGSINIPVESNMVRRFIHGQGVAQAQKEAMQAVTLKLHRIGEEAEAKREDAGATPPIQVLGKKSAPKALQPTTYAAAVEALSTSSPKKAYTHPVSSDSSHQRHRQSYAKR